MSLKTEVEEVLAQLEWWAICDTEAFFAELAQETTMRERTEFGERFNLLVGPLEDFSLSFWDEPPPQQREEEAA